MPQLGRGIARQVGGFSRETVRDGTDKGRWEATRVNRHRYAFRTPSLLNVAATAPYGHAGAYETLEAVVRHHLDPVQALAQYDHTLAHLPQFQDGSVSYPGSQAAAEAALADWKARNPQGPVRLPNGAVHDLVEFLKTLTDPCVVDADCVKQWIPDADTPSPDGQRLLARIAPEFLIAR